MTQAHVNLLAGALERDGALAGLRTLLIYCTLPGRLSFFTRELARGAAPLLQRFFFDDRGRLTDGVKIGWIMFPDRRGFDCCASCCHLRRSCRRLHGVEISRHASVGGTRRT